MSPEEKKKKREEKAKKKDDKKEEDHTIKILEYMLYEFDLMNPRGGNVDDYLDEEDPSSVQEIFDSFQGYFSKSECRRALHLNKHDTPNSI